MPEGPRAGAGRDWGRALSWVKAGKEPGLPTGLEGRPSRAAVAWCPGHITGGLARGDPRIQSLTHRTQQGVSVTRVPPEWVTAKTG